MCRPYESAVYRPCTPHSRCAVDASCQRGRLLAKTTAGLLHPATFGALKAAGMSSEESAEVVADFPRPPSSRGSSMKAFYDVWYLLTVEAC
jgi:hypothetical protein